MASPSKSFEYFYDIVCPYAYIASTQVERISAQTNATLVLKPILLGGLFTANDDTVAAKGSFADTMGEAKRSYMSMDLARFVREREAQFNFPSHHPRRSVLALRVLLYFSSPDSPYTGAKFDMWRLSQLLFRAYWVDGVDISSATELALALAVVGISEALITEANESAYAKDALIARTKEAVDRELFGVPTFFVTIDGKLQERMIYGQDQLELLETMLGGTSHLAELTLKGQPRLHPVSFLFDFASPYTYLSSLHVEQLFGSSVNFVPVLLGAIFKGVGQHNTPAATMSASRQRWASSEIFVQLNEMNAPFNWASRFPIRTILPLRFSIAAGPDTREGRRLIAALFKAFWADDLDPNDPEVCIQVANACGIDGKALFEKSNSPQVKDQLHKNTSTALSSGVFGLPTAHHENSNLKLTPTITHETQIIVHKPEGNQMYWGHDRLLWAYKDAIIPANARL